MDIELNEYPNGKNDLTQEKSVRSKQNKLFSKEFTNTNGQTDSLKELIELAREHQRANELLVFNNIIDSINDKFLAKLETKEDNFQDYLSVCFHAINVFSNFKCNDCNFLADFFYLKIKNKVLSNTDLVPNTTLVSKILRISKDKDPEFHDEVYNRFVKTNTKKLMTRLGTLIIHKTLSGEIAEFDKSVVNIIKSELKTGMFWRDTVNNSDELEKSLLTWGTVYYNCTENAKNQFPLDMFMSAWEEMYHTKFNEKNLEAEKRTYYHFEID